MLILLVINAFDIELAAVFIIYVMLNWLHVIYKNKMCSFAKFNFVSTSAD